MKSIKLHNYFKFRGCIKIFQVPIDFDVYGDLLTIVIKLFNINNNFIRSSFKSTLVMVVLAYVVSKIKDKVIGHRSIEDIKQK